MKHDFSDIELAYDSVSSQAPSMCVAYISRTHGTIFYLDDATGVSDELPEDFETSDDYLEIPHKNDLDLGVPLVKRFIGKVRPELSDDVRSIFSRKGAYSRYKSLLERNRILDDWYQFEQQQTEAELKLWCEQNGITLAP